MWTSQSRGAPCIDESPFPHPLFIRSRLLRAGQVNQAERAPLHAPPCNLGPLNVGDGEGKPGVSRPLLVSPRSRLSITTRDMLCLRLPRSFQPVFAWPVRRAAHSRAITARTAAKLVTAPLAKWCQPKVKHKRVRPRSHGWQFHRRPPGGEKNPKVIVLYFHINDDSASNTTMASEMMRTAGSL